MFMEISPKLFDECTNRYKQAKQTEKKKQKDHEDTWLKLENLAEQNAGKNAAILSTIVRQTSDNNRMKINAHTDSNSSDNDSGSDIEEGEDVLTKDISRTKFNVILYN